MKGTIRHLQCHSINCTVMNLPLPFLVSLLLWQNSLKLSKYEFYVQEIARTFLRIPKKLQETSEIVSVSTRIFKSLMMLYGKVEEKSVPARIFSLSPFSLPAYPSDTSCFLTELIRAAYWQLIELSTHTEATTAEQFAAPALETLKRSSKKQKEKKSIQKN